MSTVLRDEYHALLEAAAAAEADFNEERSLLERIPWETAAIGENDTLLVVDMQIDFLPGGAFGVDEGDAIIDGVCETIQKFHKAGKYCYVVSCFALYCIVFCVCCIRY